MTTVNINVKMEIEEQNIVKIKYILKNDWILVNWFDCIYHFSGD